MNGSEVREEIYGAAMKALCKKEGKEARMPGCMKFGTSFHRETPAELTLRRERVLAAMATGKPQRVIAEELDIEFSAVRRDIRFLKNEGRL